MVSPACRHMVRVLGPLLIDDGERTLGARDLGGARPKQVLEILLCARGHSVPVDRIAEAVWGDDPPQDAAGSLHTFVSVLRRHLAPTTAVARQLVVTEPEAYRFATDRVVFDLDRFDALLEQSAHQRTRAARASVEQALDLVRGEPFEDEPYAAWATDLRGSYQGRILGARLDAADLALAELDFASALAHAGKAVAIDHFSERAQRSEMLALYALGRGHESLERYRNFRRRLSEELGLEPTAETRALESAMLRQEDVHSLLPRPIHAEDSGAGGANSLHLLGRQRELGTLSASIRRALSGSLVLLQIDGEAGVGKTRLLEELHRELRDARIGRSGASELEAHLPYVPLATALREALGDSELDAERMPALSAILPELRLGAPQREFAEVETLEALVAVLADHAPLVLMLDDLQWADPQTIAALGYLRRRGVGLRVAVIVAGRTADAPADHPLRRLKPDETIALEPLSPGDLAPLGSPDLHERTGGNPRFVAEEMVNARSERPSSTLADALVAQCRAEGRWSYRVLLAACLLEQPFDPVPLAELVSADPDPLTEELERLCERRILRVDGARFRFRYDLIRRVLLARISPARQRLLQQRLARPISESSMPTAPLG
jgi:DNA-binding SARP family transcriptional activator